MASKSLFIECENNDGKNALGSQTKFVFQTKILEKIMDFSEEHLCHCVTPCHAAVFHLTTQSTERMFDGKAEIKIHGQPDSIPLVFGTNNLKVRT